MSANKEVETLAVITTLTDLDMSGLESDDNGKFAAELVEGATSLTSLWFCESGLDLEGAGLLAASLAGKASLARLNLNRNDIGDVGATFLGEALASNSKLLALALSDNEIGDNGAAKLGEGVEVNISLTDLACMKITSATTARHSWERPWRATPSC